MMLPKLRFPGFEGEWEAIKLNEISEKVTKKNTSNSLDLVFSNSAVYGLVLQSEYFDKSIANKNNLQGYYIVKPYDFVYNPRISSNAEVGAMSVNNTSKTGLVSPLYTVFRISTDKVSCQFLEVLFKSKVWHNHMYEIANYGARDDRMNIKNEDFYEMVLRIPKKDEQAKITLFLLKIISRIDTQKKTIQNLKLSKSAFFRKIISKKIRFKKSNKEYFSDWKKLKLSEISNEHLDKNNELKYEEVFSVAKQKGVINQIEHLGRSFAAKDLGNYKVIYPGDLVYTKSPTSDFPFGIIKQNKTGRTGVVSPLYCVFTPQNYSLGFIIHEYFTSSVKTYNYLNPLVQKGAKNTMNINNDTFLNGDSILLPTDLEEQTKIANFLNAFDKKIQLETEILSKLEEQKRYFLQNLFV